IYTACIFIVFYLVQIVALCITMPKVKIFFFCRINRLEGQMSLRTSIHRHVQRRSGHIADLELFMLFVLFMRHSVRYLRYYVMDVPYIYCNACLECIYVFL